MLNPVHASGDHQRIPIEDPQYEAPICRLPKEIILYILSIHQADRDVLRSCKRLYRIGFEAKDPSVNNQSMFINAICNKEIELCIKLLSHKKIDPAAGYNSAIRWACQYDSPEIVNLLLEDPRVDPSVFDNSVICAACRTGLAKTVEALLKNERVDPAARDNEPIQSASESGKQETVKYLLESKRVNPASRDNYAIRIASEKGHLGVVQELLKSQEVDPAAQDNYAIRIASEKGHIEVVQELLKSRRVNPAAQGYYAIRIAGEKGHLEVVKELLEAIRPIYNCDPSLAHTYNFDWACERGYSQIVDMILKDYPGVDPAHHDNYPIRWAIHLEHWGVVKVLLKDARVPPPPLSSLKNHHVGVELLSLMLKKNTCELASHSSSLVRWIISHVMFLKLIIVIFALFSKKLAATYALQNEVCGLEKRIRKINLETNPRES